jgi:hypothetical protein
MKKQKEKAIIRRGDYRITEKLDKGFDEVERIWYYLHINTYHATGSKQWCCLRASTDLSKLEHILDHLQPII